MTRSCGSIGHRKSGEWRSRSGTRYHDRSARGGLRKSRPVHQVDDRQRLVGRVRVVLLDPSNLFTNTVLGGLFQEVLHEDCVCALRSGHSGFEFLKTSEVRIERPLDWMRGIEHLLVLGDLAHRETRLVELEVVPPARSDTHACRNLAHLSDMERCRGNLGRLLRVDAPETFRIVLPKLLRPS